MIVYHKNCFAATSSQFPYSKLGGINKPETRSVFNESEQK